MICVPLLNDATHLHLTLADWELLNFSHLAIDGLSLLIKPRIAIPNSAQIIFFDTKKRECHKVSRTNLLSSPFDGQKIPITDEKLHELFKKITHKYPGKTIIWMDEKNSSIAEEYKNYEITGQPGQDAEKGIFYDYSSTPEYAKCPCYTCQNFTLEYLDHLRDSGVLLGTRLRIVHNLSVAKFKK